MPKPRHGNLRKSADLSELFAEPLGIDLSAWISGASFILGIAIAGPHALLASTWNCVAIACAFLAFLAFVVLVQRHMRVSAGATGFGTPQNLVTGGIFEFSRNPIYLAFLLPLASMSVVSIFASGAATAFYVLAMNATVIPREEQDLKRLFGRKYTDYAAATRRWI